MVNNQLINTQIISREMNPATHTTMTSKPTILALDLGTKMGWAMQSLSRVSGTVDFKNSPDAKVGQAQCFARADHPDGRNLGMD